MNSTSVPVISGLGEQSMVTGSVEGKQKQGSTHWPSVRRERTTTVSSRPRTSFERASMLALSCCVLQGALFACNCCLGEGLVSDHEY